MRIAVIGGGTMGSLVGEQLVADDRYELAGIVDRRLEGDGLYKGLREIEGEIHGIIDFSHPSYLDEVVDYSVEKGIPLLIATTGYSSEDRYKIEKAGKKIPVIFTYNTSLGVNLLGELVKRAAGALGEAFDIEVIEKHHNKKLDSPSGTAKLLVGKIGEGYEGELNPVYGREGMTRREKGEIGVHAIRGGSIVGEHSVIFAGMDEIIEIKHEALSKTIFVRGALTGIAYLQGRERGLYTMKDVLGL